MLKKLVFLAPLLLAGCATHITNLTPHQQSRNANNLYPVEAAFDSREQSIRWQTIRPEIVVGNDLYPMRPTPMMTNRWEGLIPVPAGGKAVRYRYKFDFNRNAFGTPHADTMVSQEYTLRILDQ